MSNFMHRELVAALSIVAAPLAAPAAPLGAPSVRISDAEEARPGDAFTTRDLATLTDFGPVTIAPDGRTAAVLSWQGNPDSNDYRFTWHILALDGRPATNVDGGELLQRPAIEDASWGGDMRGEAALWSSDGSWFYYRRRSGDDIQVWRTSADGARSEQVTRSPGPVRAFTVDSSDTVIFAADASAEERREAFRREGERGFRFDDRFIPTFAHLPAIGRYRRDMLAGIPAEREQLFAQPAAGPERLATDAERRAYDAYVAIGPLDVRNIRRGDREAALAVFEPERNRGPFAPRMVQLHRGRTTVTCNLAECRGQIAGLGFSQDGGQVYFARREDVNLLARAIYAWDVDAGTVRLVRRDASVDILARCEFSTTLAICHSEAPSRPRSVTRIDLASGEERPLLDPNGLLASRRHGPIRRLDIVNSWGQDAYAYLTLPPDYRPGTAYPLVVVTYRARGFQRGGIGDEYPVFPFAEQGYAVLALDRPEDWTALEREEDVVAIERAETDQMRERRVTLETIELGVSEPGAPRHRQSRICRDYRAQRWCRDGELCPQPFADLHRRDRELGHLGSLDGFPRPGHHLASLRSRPRSLPKRRLYRRPVAGDPRRPGLRSFARERVRDRIYDLR